MAEIKNIRILWIILFLIIVVLVCPFAYGDIIYVDDDAAGANDGTNWANAYWCLQNALDNVSIGDEIRVAQGIYKPDQEVMTGRYTRIVSSGHRIATFQLKNGVAIKGGYAGVGEPDPDARDIELYKTILSGDLDGNDRPYFKNNDENSYHVVTGRGTDETAVLDGFTITAGNANSNQPHNEGGGMLNDFGSPTVTNCTFSGNSAEYGGGIRNRDNSPTLTHCTFENNSAGEAGGGMLNDGDQGTPVVTNCTFSGNTADYGAGMNNRYGCSTVVRNCTFTANSARNEGGGMWNENNSPMLTHCTFENNSAGSGGGGMFNAGDHCTPVVTDCIFSGNTSDIAGGGMTNEVGSRTVVTNCTFTGNSARNDGGGMFSFWDSSPTVANCIFISNSAINGGGMFNSVKGNPIITNCIFTGNLAQGSGGGVWIDDGSAMLTNCILWGNTATSGPQLALYENSSVSINYCDLQGGLPGINFDPSSFANWGFGNIDADPLFIDAANGDYHLRAGSPCIDAGDNSAIPEGVITDLDGNPRIINGTVDMGAYEFAVTYQPNVYYVDVNAAGSNDGTSWVDAYKCLQDALAMASSGDEILVAQGTYKPDQRVLITAQGGQIISSGDRTETFRLINSVAIKGGYAGLGEPNPNARNIELYETILSGDLSGDDVEVSDPRNLPSELTRVENSYHVVVGSGTNETAVLDGFTITSGNANGLTSTDNRGGGVYNEGGSPTFIRCIFHSNNSIPSYSGPADGGGAMFNAGGRPALTQCTFTKNNSARDGGGMFNINSRPTVTHCTFSGNSSDISGGGIYNHNSSPVVTDCIFTGNSAQRGGGMRNMQNNNPTLTNCVFVGNWVENRGESGGVVAGGVMANQNNSSPILTNCILWGNTPDEIYASGGMPLITYCNVQSGWTGQGNIDANPLFADIDKGDYHLKSQTGRWDPNSQSWVQDDVTSPCIDAGDPNSDWSGEIWPNGERINMGAYGGTHQASMSLETQGLSLPRVVYIYLYNDETTKSFESLLENYGCPTTLIKPTNIPATSLDSYDLIVIGHNTQYEDTWSDPNTVAAIEDSNKPLVGLGDGGYDFFGVLGLSIGNPYGGHGSKNSIEVVDPNSSLFSTPYSIDIPADNALQLYTETNHIGIYLWPTIPETVTVFGNEVNDAGYYPLVAEHNRYLLWGFTESPEKMTEIGKTLFVNVVIRTANKAWESEN